MESSGSARVLCRKQPPPERPCPTGREVARERTGLKLVDVSWHVRRGVLTTLGFRGCRLFGPSTMRCFPAPSHRVAGLFHASSYAGMLVTKASLLLIHRLAKEKSSIPYHPYNVTSHFKERNNPTRTTSAIHYPRLFLALREGTLVACNLAFNCWPLPTTPPMRASSALRHS